MKWKTPPKIKIYEALGCLSDGRLQVDNDEVRVYSSSEQKYYTVEYDPENQAIMANDNGSYWQSYLGYPSIAYLMSVKELPFDARFASALKGIAWKKINTRNKNDFLKTEAEVNQILKDQQIDLEEFSQFLNQVEKAIEVKGLIYLGKKKLPPKGD